jgi:unsaturated rhamnogalacturonyl hydrolase
MFNHPIKIKVLASVCGMFILPQCLPVAHNPATETQVVAKEKTVLLDYYYNNEWKKNKEGVEARWHYTWEDPTFGGYSVLGDIFKKEGAKLSSLDKKPTAANLKDAAIYIIVDPDTAKESAKPNYMDAEAAGVIADWVKKGGVLVLLTNDSGNAELEKFNTLSEKFGIHFNEDSHNRVQNDAFEQGAVLTPENHEIFGSSKKLYVKEYSSLKLTSPAKAVLKSGDNDLMAVAKYGKGTVFALGDPWIYNEYVGGKKMPADFVNYDAAGEFAKWLLKQAK